MQTTEMIIVSEFCTHHQIDIAFINALRDSGLVEVYTSEEQLCMSQEQLPNLEKMVRLYEMDINLEGIETITYLLERMKEMQQQISILNSRLNLYEQI